MKLSQLLSAIGAASPQDPDITALICDSRETVPGSLFVALEGANTDGRTHIPEALERGASAVVCRPPLPEHIPGAVVDDPGPPWLCWRRNSTATRNRPSSLSPSPAPKEKPPPPICSGRFSPLPDTKPA